MSKIRVLSDQLANQIAAGEVVERPASVAKELVENAIDADARRISVDVEAGGRKLLRVMDDGCGMTRDDALLAFERHATSKIKGAEDLDAIATLGFRGEALASIASVARVELITKTENDAAATRVLIEGGRMRDVKDAAHPRGTTLSVRDLFFNVPARRKFLRSEATESFHLTNLVTHYALAHPEIAFTLTNNGREVLRAAPAADLRERVYQIFGAEFLEKLLEVTTTHSSRVARVRGYISAPRERRNSRDAQYLFINGRYVRDRLIGRALSDGYRSILPSGVYPAALLFLEIPYEEVDVNVHPAKTEVRFRRAAAVADSVREAVRSALASAGYTRAIEAVHETITPARDGLDALKADEDSAAEPRSGSSVIGEGLSERAALSPESVVSAITRELVPPTRQASIEFGFAQASEEEPYPEEWKQPLPLKGETARGLDAILRRAQTASAEAPLDRGNQGTVVPFRPGGVERNEPDTNQDKEAERSASPESALPPLTSAANIVREVPLDALSRGIRPLGQLADSFIIATDTEGLLLIDQHVAHERILFDKYRRLEASRPADSQHLLMPETFDLTPAQAAVFDTVSEELETYGFGLMRLSGRTIAIKAVPADLPAGEARNMLAELLETIESEKRGANLGALRDEIAASLARRAAIKSNTPLAAEKMRWLIESLLQTSSPTTCPHGRPVILRLTTRDIEKGFHRG
ncbi:MAG TPA: DNA mismatch repair endonuclease MutL [Pyrinomonadaceae bacterium]|nr:DNA mismatch repair endonuclease MutL [Pyrinomonadaceae bacterium]